MPVSKARSTIDPTAGKQLTRSRGKAREGKKLGRRFGCRHAVDDYDALRVAKVALAEAERKSSSQASNMKEKMNNPEYNKTRRNR